MRRRRDDDGRRRQSEFDRARRIMAERSRTHPWRLESGNADQWHVVWRWFETREDAEMERERLRRWGAERSMSGVEYRVMENAKRPSRGDVAAFMKELARIRRGMGVIAGERLKKARRTNATPTSR